MREIGGNPTRQRAQILIVQRIASIALARLTCRAARPAIPRIIVMHHQLFGEFLERILLEIPLPDLDTLMAMIPCKGMQYR